MALGKGKLVVPKQLDELEEYWRTSADISGFP